MASKFKRGNLWWIKYKEDGVWKAKSTGYRTDNMGDTRQADLMVREQIREEQIQEIPDSQEDQWEKWVIRWLTDQYQRLDPVTGKPVSTTYDRYMRSWRKLVQWLDEIKINRPKQLTYNHTAEYPRWRLNHGGKKNTAIGELKLLGLVMQQAQRRGFCTDNPARNLGLKKELTKEKTPWEDHEITLVAKELAARQFGSWMHVTFLFGLYQSARLRQAALPLHCIELERARIHYPANIVKKMKAFSQPIDRRFLPVLTEIVAQRKNLSKNLLCDIPDFGAS